MLESETAGKIASKTGGAAQGEGIFAVLGGRRAGRGERNDGDCGRGPRDIEHARVVTTVHGDHTADTWLALVTPRSRLARGADILVTTSAT